MSFEIERFEVENHEVQGYVNWMGAFGWYLKSSQRIYSRTQTPTSAIKFENVVLVNSSTEVEDFTELVFERDKNIPNYDEISALEDEALDLLPYYSQKRPLKPAEKMSFKDWVKNKKPSVFPLWIDILRTIGCFGLFTLILSAPPALRDLGPILVWAALIASVVFTVVSNIVLRTSATLNPDKKVYSYLLSEYSNYSEIIDEQHKKYDMYDEASERIPEIIREVASLLRG